MSQNAENTENNKTVQSNNKTVAKNEQKKKKSNIAKLINLVVLVMVLGGLFWVVKSYFNFGNDKYTNADSSRIIY
jgi:membrane fusion protein (multidrug efflux system)